MMHSCIATLETLGLIDSESEAFEAPPSSMPVTKRSSRQQIVPVGPPRVYPSRSTYPTEPDIVQRFTIRDLPEETP
jgi:hypothetical protein